MIVCPIRKEYVSFFKGKEELLSTLLEKDYKQLDCILEKIDVADFSYGCLNFYHSEEYKISHNTIFYTNEITNKKNYCSLQYRYIKLQQLDSFSAFLERYFQNCFICDDEFRFINWFSYEENYLFE